MLGAYIFTIVMSSSQSVLCDTSVGTLAFFFYFHFNDNLVRSYAVFNVFCSCRTYFFSVLTFCHSCCFRASLRTFLNRACVSKLFQLQSHCYYTIIVMMWWSVMGWGEVFYNLRIKSQSFSGAVSLDLTFTSVFQFSSACREAKKLDRAGTGERPFSQVREVSSKVLALGEWAFVGQRSGCISQWLLSPPPTITLWDLSWLFIIRTWDSWRLNPQKCGPV